MRGWVYILSNPAMSGIYKIGFSSKDPEIRAQELNNTGVPHPYQVEFDVLVQEPFALEQSIHRSLHEYREGKEWFRCALDKIVETVAEVAGDSVILRNDRRTPNKEGTTPEAPMRRARPFTKTATFDGPCHHCGRVYRVTLTRHDTGAQCPYCFKRTPLSLFSPGGTDN